MPIPLSVVYRSLAELHGAGVAWPDALSSALGRSGRTEALSGSRDAAIAALRAGRPPSEALADAVPAIDRAMLRAGEESGRMEAVLRDLADRHEELARRRREETRALAYPLVVAHVAAVLAGLPDLVFGRLGAALGWALVFLIPTHVLLAIRRHLRRADAEGKPVSGPFARLRSRSAVEEADARAFDALGRLHEAGVPPSEAIPLAARAGRGGRACDDLDDAVAEVAAGRPYAGAWRRIPDETRTTLEIGERTGSFDVACERVARALSESAIHRRAMAAARVAPIALVLVGGVVALRVITFYARALSEATSIR